MTVMIEPVIRHERGICSRCKERKVAVSEFKDESGKTHCWCDNCMRENENGKGNL